MVGRIRRGQASLEYMVMLSLSLAIFAAILYVTGNLITSSSSHIGLDASYRAVQRIGEAADFIYVHGHPSKTRINVYVPPNIENVSVVGFRYVNMRIAVGDSYTDVYVVPRTNITGLEGLCDPVCREGYYVLSVESTPMQSPTNGIVNITKQ
ncbi:Uncharacterised protein [uncultured archaeon]|nr:Uncharacterised protein [uncultured archaeon]